MQDSNSRYEIPWQLWLGLVSSIAIVPVATAVAAERPLHIEQVPFLNDEAVERLYQDRQGYLWIGTFMGLYRYDGHRFIEFATDPDDPSSFSGNLVYSIVEDHEGDVWIGTALFGLNRFDPATHTFEHYVHDPDDPSSLADNDVLEVFEDSSHRLWVASRRSGLSLFDRRTEGFRHLVHDPSRPESFPHETVLDFAESREGLLWLATDAGVCRFDPERERFDPVTEIGASITSIALDKSGKLWAGSWGRGRIYQIDPNSLEATLVESHSDTWHVTNMLADRQGRLWTGFWGYGLGVWNGELNQHTYHRHDPNDRFSLSGNTVKSLLEDQSGVLWVGTTQGLNKVFPKMTTSQFGSNGRDLRRHFVGGVGALYHDGRNTLWAGAANGLVRIDIHSGMIERIGEKEPELAELGDAEILAISGAPQGGLLIATERSRLLHFDPMSKVLEPQPVEAMVRVIHHQGNGIYWLGTGDPYVPLRFDLREKSVEAIPIFDSDDSGPFSTTARRVNAVIGDSNGVIWFATNGLGLHWYEPSTGERGKFLHDPSDPSSLASNIVTALLEGEANAIWVGTDNGLLRLNASRDGFQRMTRKDGLSDNHIRHLLLSDDGILWAGTHRKLNRIDPATGDVRVFGPANGLVNSRSHLLIHQGTSARLSDGRLVFGGNNGLDIFQPGDLAPEIRHAVINFPSIRINDQPWLDLNQDGVPILPPLTYQQNSLRFEFSLADYRNSDETIYRTQLVGFDEQSRQSTVPSREYLRIPPGDYVFQVSAENPDGAQSAGTTSIPFRISPPFWKTAPFQFGVAAMGLVLLLVGYRIRLRALRLRQRELEFQVDRRTQELKTALEDVRTLRGILPICASCKNIRDDHGYWKQVELYIEERSDAEFTHGICPDCIKRLYPELADEIVPPDR